MNVHFDCREISSCTSQVLFVHYTIGWATVGWIGYGIIMNCITIPLDLNSVLEELVDRFQDLFVRFREDKVLEFAPVMMRLEEVKLGSIQVY